MLSLAQPLAISSRRRLPSISTMRAAANAFESPSPSLSQPPLGQQLFSGQTGEPSQGLFAPPIETSTDPPVTISPEMQRQIELSAKVTTPEERAEMRKKYELEAEKLREWDRISRMLRTQQVGVPLPWRKSPSEKERLKAGPPASAIASLEFQGLLEDFGLQGMQHLNRPGFALQMFNEYQKVRPYVAPLLMDPELTLATVNQLMESGMYVPQYLNSLWTAMKSTMHRNALRRQGV